jgi:hypothetical protein
VYSKSIGDSIMAVGMSSAAKMFGQNGTMAKRVASGLHGAANRLGGARPPYDE